MSPHTPGARATGDPRQVPCPPNLSSMLSPESCGIYFFLVKPEKFSRFWPLTVISEIT